MKSYFKTISSNHTEYTPIDIEDKLLAQKVWIPAGRRLHPLRQHDVRRGSFAQFWCGAGRPIRLQCDI